MGIPKGLAAVPGWERLPADLAHRDVAAVAVDRNDRVYLATRMRSCIFVYEQDGTFVRTWGEGLFSDRLHGLTIHPDGTLFVVDDGGNSVRHFTTEGKELAPIGPVGKTSDTGYDGTNLATVARAAGPYNRPTNIAVAPNGDLYVSDGYGNARVHQVSPDGRLLLFTSNRAGPRQVFVMRPDGTGAQNVSRSEAADWATSWQPVR